MRVERGSLEIVCGDGGQIFCSNVGFWPLMLRLNACVQGQSMRREGTNAWFRAPAADYAPVPLLSPLLGFCLIAACTAIVVFLRSPVVTNIVEVCQN